MACNRHSFTSPQEADKFLRYKAWSNKVTGQRPIRWYRCPKCKKIHVTSKPRREHG